MPLIFIAVFLASFLAGSGASYIVQQGQNSSGIPTATTSPNTTIIPDQTACLPERDLFSTIHQLTAADNAVSIEATADLPIPVSNSEQRLTGDGLSADIAREENWTRILLWLFGGENRNGQNSDPVLDRRTKNWTLIKRDVPIPAWKVAYQSGNIIWNIHECVWGDSASCDVPPNNSNIVFHEMTRIGVINTSSVSDTYLQNRYQKVGSDDAKGDVWVATGWCGESGDGMVIDGNPADAINAQNRCSDPLVRDLLFVVTKKGDVISGSACDNVDGLPCDSPRLGRGAGIPKGPDQNESTKQQSWWRFDVYYNFGGLTPSFGNLPCWMRSCGRNPTDPFDPNLRINDPNCLTGPTPVSQRDSNLMEYLSGDVNQDNPELNKNNSGNYLATLKNNVLQKLSHLFLNINKTVSAQTASNFPQFISGRAIIPLSSQNVPQSVLVNTYILAETVSTLPGSTTNVGSLTGSDGTIYQVFVENNELVKPTLTPVPGTSGTGGVNPANQIFLQAATIVRYSLVHSENNQGETVKLDSFVPPLSQVTPVIPETFTYEWYTPACKPAIYLYPQTETKLSIYLIPQGKLTESTPFYNNGWKNIIARPDGQLVLDGVSFPYLYYEADIKNVSQPKQGWVIKQEKLEEFFNTLLPYLGLNNYESNDFKDYWVKKLKASPYYFVGLVDRNSLDQYEAVSFSQSPDTFIRVRFYFAGLDNNLFFVTPPLLPPTPQRLGFTAVDWGGMLAGGSCGETIHVE